ncbi:MAG: hypothetical protein ACTSYS_13835 [Promethearchaeota archaeon]
MARRKSWAYRNRYALIGGVALLVIIGIVTYYGFFAPGLSQQPAQQGFSITVKDGSRQIEISDSDITYTLYGTDDLSEWSEFEEIENGTSLSISSGDLDGYTYYVVKMNATVSKSDYDADDAGIDKIDEKYDHEFYTRWFVIDPNSANTFYLYEKPSAVGIVAVYSENFTAITNVSTVEATTNVTFIVGSNKTQQHAYYVQGSNYQNEYDDSPTILVNFNTTISLSDVTMVGASKIRYNSTAIRFEFTQISSVPTILDLKWDDEVTNKAISDVSLLFGETSLATV